jgi:LmbE family N-acetylglucosaminyl deacetylase
MTALVVISPHLDDGVLSCGRLLAGRPGSAVLTVFAGTPLDDRRVTEWDRRCGFDCARDAMASRRREDDAALTLLQARPVRLPFCDSQYGETPSRDEVHRALREALVGLAPEVVLYPMGLFHSDHVRVHEATRAALSALRGVQAWVYEDALYRGLRGLMQQRLADFARDGLVATPLRLGGDDAYAALKRSAVHAYRSQLQAFGPTGYADAEQAERYWRLESADESEAAAR